ncbi:MAG: SPW repeat protein [Patescibacteria group bacterium]
MLTEKIQAGLGLWIIISPWFLGFSSVSFLTWSNVLVGTAIFLVNIWKIFGQDPESPTPRP